MGIHIYIYTRSFGRASRGLIFPTGPMPASHLARPSEKYIALLNISTTNASCHANRTVQLSNMPDRPVQKQTKPSKQLTISVAMNGTFSTPNYSWSFFVALTAHEPSSEHE